MKFGASTKSFVMAALALSAMGSAHAAGDWQTTLQARDINGDGQIDAYYDTALNVTWLASLNAAAGSRGDLVKTNDTVAYVASDGSGARRSGVAVPYDDVGPGGLPSTKYAYGDGLMTLANASAWASGLDVYGVKGWRLPSAADLGSPGCVDGQADCGTNLDLSRSELAHMYYTTLGNTAHGAFETVEPNKGPFVRTSFPQDGSTSLRSSVFWLDNGWAFNTLNGYQNTNFSATEVASWAVHAGDVPHVSSVPEMGTFASMALGLLGVAGLAKRKRS